MAATVLQPKLTIGAPDDAYEKEADEVAKRLTTGQPDIEAASASSDGDDDEHRSLARKAADQNLVRQMLLRRIPVRTLQQTLGNRALARLLQQPLPVPAPSELRRNCACGGGSERECDECRQNRLALQRDPMGADSGGAAPSMVEDVLATPGQPLAESARTALEPRFGHDFGEVRVHDDSNAAESALAVNALAYTVGSHIVFGKGQYAPGTSQGDYLLAHELTHVVQQSRLPHLASAGRRLIQRDEAGGASGGSSGASATSSSSSQVKDFSRLSPGVEIDVADGRAFALAAIDKMSPFGAKVSAPPSDLIASTGPDTSGAVATSRKVQTAALQSTIQRSGGGTVKPEAGFVGSIQLCYDACNGELSVVGWIWAGGGGVTPGLLGGHGWWGAYVFAEKEFLKTTLGFMPTLHCGTCRTDCKPNEGTTDWGGGISGFPIALKPGERSSLKQAGIELGLLITPRSLCDVDLELIALIDLTKYLGPVGAAVVAAEELANTLGKKLGVSIECGIGIDLSGLIHLCKSVPGGGLLGITSDSARICGGGYVSCGIGLEHDKSALPGV